MAEGNDSVTSWRRVDETEICLDLHVILTYFLPITLVDTMGAHASYFATP